MVGEGAGKARARRSPAQRDFFPGKKWARDSEFCWLRTSRTTPSLQRASSSAPALSWTRGGSSARRISGASSANSGPTSFSQISTCRSLTACTPWWSRARPRAPPPDIPFIFVSGPLGEDYAIRALKNGATDYVLKTNLVRLPPVVERAVSEAAARSQRKRGEQLLALEHTVVRQIADADNASQGLKAFMRSICESEGWDLGRYFRVDEKAGLLRFEESWCLPDPSLEKFVEGSREMTLAPGAGLMGLVWQAGEP